jgi:hypothetical protein
VAKRLVKIRSLCILSAGASYHSPESGVKGRAVTMSRLPRIVSLEARDVRFPTSRWLDGSDAMHTDPDYSAAYVVLRTDADDGGAGSGLLRSTCLGIVTAHIVHGYSLREIATHLGCSVTTVHRRIRACGDAGRGSSALTAGGTKGT